MNKKESIGDTTCVSLLPSAKCGKNVHSRYRQSSLVKFIFFLKGGYDLKIGTSERGHVSVDDAHFKLPSFKYKLQSTLIYL